MRGTRGPHPRPPSTDTGLAWGESGHCTGQGCSALTQGCARRGTRLRLAGCGRSKGVSGVCSADACPIQDAGFPLTATSFPSDLHLRVPGQSSGSPGRCWEPGQGRELPIPRPRHSCGARLAPLLAPRGLRPQQEPRHRLRAVGDSSSRHACSASPPPHSQALGHHPWPLHGHGSPAWPRAHTSSATALTGASWTGEDDAHL